MGRYLVTENDIQERKVFEDEIAFGGWFVDLHTPGGLLAPTSEPASAEGYAEASDYAVKSYCGPYGIPLRCCIAKDATNLMMAGRNISATHAALGTIRVMATTALLGQACGTAAAYGIKRGLALEDLTSGQPIADIRQALLRDSAFLPNAVNADPDDLARQAKADASSSASLIGAGPEDRGAHDGLAIWKDQPQYEREKLECRKGQIIAVDQGRLEKVSVCLSNHSNEPQTISLQLHPVDHIWDYRIELGEPLAAGELVVEPGEQHWCTWDVGLDLPADRAAGTYLRLDLLPNPHIQWHLAGCVVPGHTGTYQIGPDKMRRFGNGATFSFRVEPGQQAYGPEQVLTGVTRPYHQTNAWRSDPATALPQSLELSWDAPQTLARVELTFPGHLLREYHAYAPFYADPQCPADYFVEARVDGTWQKLAEAADNFQRRCVHVWDAVSADRLRVTVTRTNGDPSASIYEMRCYASP